MSDEIRIVRVTINLPQHTVDKLRLLAQRLGCTITEALRLSVHTHFIEVEAVTEGKKILIHDEATNETKELVIVLPTTS